MAELRLHKAEPVTLENLTIAPETVSLKVGGNARIERHGELFGRNTDRRNVNSKLQYKQ